MRIRIYQIEMSLDGKRVAFMPYAYIREKYSEGFPSELYCKVHEGTVEADSLEDVFYIFNMAHPQDYRARSLSVSDVIEVVEENHSTFYYCDTIGFREVPFNTLCLIK